MKDTELKKLNREQLIEIIYQLRKEQMSLEDENNDLKQQLEARHISISNAGSIAQAAVEITGIFQKAQDAADLYLNEVINNTQEVITAKETADKIVNDARAQAHKIRLSAIKRSKSMLKAADERLQRADELYKRLESRNNDTDI